MMIRKITALFIFLMLMTNSLFALSMEYDYEDKFKESNQLYVGSQYDRALSQYQKLSLIDPTAETFYNLGNAYYKEKKLGYAIASYERAKLLAPRDQDVNKNLKFVRGLIETKVEDKREWHELLSNKLISTVTFSEILLISLIVLFLLLIWMLLLLIIRRNPFRGKVFGFLVSVTLISVLFTALTYSVSYNYVYGIVVRSDSEVRYGPSKDEKVIFRMSEGLRVRILSEQASWDQIQLMSEDRGWISKEDIEIIKV